MDRHLIFYYIGIAILFCVNIMSLRIVGGRYSGFPNIVAVSNLLGAVFIVYYFMHKEKYIQF